MNDNQFEFTPVKLYEHGSAEYRKEVPAEPFPVICRETYRTASNIGYPHIRKTTTYHLGDFPRREDTVRLEPLHVMDPEIDDPIVLMILTHPLSTDLEDIEKSLQNISRWRGAGIKPFIQWRKGRDRLWTLHTFDPIPGTHSHIIIRHGFKMSSVEGLHGEIELDVYEEEIRKYREKNNEGIHWHRYYASDAPVPGTALHSPNHSTEEQIGEWFRKRLSVQLPDGTQQKVIGIEIKLNQSGGVAYSAISQGSHILAHRCDFNFSLGDEFNDTLTWTSTYEGWDEAYYPKHLAALLTPPTTPSAIEWRKRVGIL